MTNRNSACRSEEMHDQDIKGRQHAITGHRRWTVPRPVSNPKRRKRGLVFPGEGLVRSQSIEHLAGIRDEVRMSFPKRRVPARDETLKQYRVGTSVRSCLRTRRVLQLRHRLAEVRPAPSDVAQILGRGAHAQLRGRARHVIRKRHDFRAEPEPIIQIGDRLQRERHLGEPERVGETATANADATIRTRRNEAGAMGAIRMGSVQIGVTDEEIEAADAFIEDGVPDRIARIDEDTVLAEDQPLRHRRDDATAGGRWENNPATGRQVTAWNRRSSTAWKAISLSASFPKRQSACLRADTGHTPSWRRSSEDTESCYGQSP